MRVAIVHPTTLLGKELRERLGDFAALAGDVQLLSTRDAEVGTLTDVAGGAAVVSRVEGSLPPSDVVFFCGPLEETRALLPKLAPESTGVVLSVGASVEDGTPIVAGVNLDQATRGSVLLSPHPGAVALARLLQPLRARLRAASATLLLPVSSLEEDGLHELFEQTRSILAFAAQPPSPILGGQLAFNVVQGEDRSAAVVDPLVALLGTELDLSVQSVLAGVFHGVAISAHLRFEGAADAAAIATTLRASEGVEVHADGDDGPSRAGRLGPIDAAQSEHLLLGEVRRDPRHEDAVWVWAALDNLTSGGTLNALAIAASLG